MRVHTAPATTASPPAWQSALTEGLTRLGWSKEARIESVAPDIAVIVVDVLLDRDITVDLVGATTFSLSILLEGSGHVSVRGLPPVDAKAGTALLFACRGGVTGEDRIRGGQRFRLVDLRFEEDFLLRAGDARLSVLAESRAGLCDAAAILTEFPAPAALLQIARDIARMPPFGLPGRRLYLHGKAIEALSIAVDAIDGPPRARRLPRPHERERLLRAREILDRDFRNRWTIARLAREVGINVKQLKYGFRDVVGQPVHAYLMALRVEAAAQMLREGTSVAGAASAVGYVNLSHFSKIFRATKGMSPSSYARME